MPLLDACTAILAAGGTVSFPYRLDAEEWVVEVKACPLSRGGFLVCDPYEGYRQAAAPEEAAAQLLELALSPGNLCRGEEAL